MKEEISCLGERGTGNITIKTGNRTLLKKYGQEIQCTSLPPFPDLESEGHAGKSWEVKEADWVWPGRPRGPFQEQLSAISQK